MAIKLDLVEFDLAPGQSQNTIWINPERIIAVEFVNEGLTFERFQMGGGYYDLKSGSLERLRELCRESE